MLHFKIGILKITWGKTCHFEFQAHLKVQGLMLITQFLYKKKKKDSFHTVHPAYNQFWYFA